MTSLVELTLTALAARIANGSVSSEQATEACLSRIECHVPVRGFDLNYSSGV